MGLDPLLEPAPLINRMADKARDMLRRAVDAFVHRDIEAARAIAVEDDVVDELYNRIYQGLLEQIICKRCTPDRSNYLLWVAHNLERTADRVTNICERVIFTVTGEMEDLGAEVCAVAAL
jgi:phosphate transport system protein